MSGKQRGRPPHTDRRSAKSGPVTKYDAVAPSQGRRWLAGLGLAAVLAAVAWGWLAWTDPPPAPATPAVVRTGATPTPTAAAARFVGAEACAGCHADEHAQWRRSQHAHAMQHATEATVLGDFDNARFTYAGIETTFFRRDGRFFINTDGPDGQRADFEISHAFGLYPLQQYLVAFPDGRRQALSIAWDARPRTEGGQRWYHLYPDEKIGHDDPLHWTRRSQNWNWMCADCHTTNFDRDYRPATDSYDSTWSEMNVACEACHGPGSNHVAWAQAPADATTSLARKGLQLALDERRGVAWLPDPGTGSARRSKPLVSQRELAVCSQCHSRRAPFAGGMDHDGRFLDTHDIALLTEGLYHADGQQLDEVYTTGSFLQSRMHDQGVTCSDCHDPHSGQLRVPGNAVCGQCHAPAAFDTPTHTLHAAGSDGAACASCHMPTRTYMGVDARHDHSFRIPRPDLAAELGTPDACTACHQDRDPAWAAGVIERAFGPERKGFQTFATALHHGRTRAPGAAAGLMALARDPQAPAIARATALVDLQPYLGTAVMPALEAGLADPDAMVRGAALEALLAAPHAERLRLAIGLIDDASRMVRIKAARALAVASPQPPAMQSRLEAVFAEYVASQRANAELPEAHINLGLFYTERRDPAQAEAEYRAALALDPDFVPAYVNLADLYAWIGREAEAEATLDAGLRTAPRHPDLSHALGLLRVRQGRGQEALPLLASAARAAPDNARYAFIHGVALHDLGQARQGIVVLEQALERFPTDPDLLDTLAAYAREAGDMARAQAYADRAAAVTVIAPPESGPARTE